jgi:hypothetical protein
VGSWLVDGAVDEFVVEFCSVRGEYLRLDLLEDGGLAFERFAPVRLFPSFGERQQVNREFIVEACRGRWGRRKWKAKPLPTRTGACDGSAKIVRTL